MRAQVLLLTTLGVLAVCPTAVAQTMTPVETVGRWNIMSYKDAMTDKVSCIGYYGDNKRIQLTDGVLSFSLGGEGGVDGYMVRLDDSPAGEMQLPDDIEKQIGVINLRFADNVQIRTASRIRVRILTLLSTTVDEDVDLKDMSGALAVIDGPKCTG